MPTPSASTTAARSRSATKKAGTEWVRYATTVYLDVIAYDPHRSRLYAGEINRVLLGHVPSAGTRLPKSDGADSAVSTFGGLAVKWSQRTPPPSARPYTHLAGELDCVWQQSAA